MFAVVAVYPSGHLVLVGFGRTVDDVNALIEECIAHNGKEMLGVLFTIHIHPTVSMA